MSVTSVLFLDGDDSLVEPPATAPAADREGLRLQPGVIPALLELKQAGYRFVRVGTGVRPGDAPDFLQRLFSSQAIDLELAPVAEWLASTALDRARSRVIGGTGSDIDLAERLGVERIRLQGDDALTWPQIATRLHRPDRVARVKRRTKETDIAVSVNLDQEAPVAISTGIGFFDHMLEQVARHGGFALELAMDEALAQVAIDLSGRPYAVFTGRFGRDAVGGLPTELVPHFFRSLADSLGAAVHVEVRGENTHHMIEACFKGVGRALRRAIRVRGTELPSSKGVL